MPLNLKCVCGRCTYGLQCSGVIEDGGTIELTILGKDHSSSVMMSPTEIVQLRDYLDGVLG